MNEYLLQCAESMGESILCCKRWGLDYSYYLKRMMEYSQAAIDRKLSRKQTIEDIGTWE